VIPPQYFTVVDEYLKVNRLDAYGGPDKAGEDFNNQQKAISYAMTSFYTTGGIRGKKSHVGQYQPRSFNMGMKRELFNRLNGFSSIKVSEDIDLSMRIYKDGKKIALIEDAFVYHKRRATLGKFFRQVFSFGYGRYSLNKMHVDAVRPVHMLPSAFVIYLAMGLPALLFSSAVFRIWLLILLIYAALVFSDSTRKNKNIAVGFLSIAATFVMLTGYGRGMLQAAFSEIKKKVDRGNH